MKVPKKTPRRRSASEWARLIDDWRKSGQSASDFAAKHGVVPQGLTWWKWRLSSRAPASAKSEGLKLVSVHLEPAPTSKTSDRSPAWELTTADGYVLRVHEGIAPAELSAVLLAFSSPRGRR